MLYDSKLACLLAYFLPYSLTDLLTCQRRTIANLLAYLLTLFLTDLLTCQRRTIAITLWDKPSFVKASSLSTEDREAVSLGAAAYTELPQVSSLALETERQPASSS